jgi:hypothetical protein
MKSANEIKERSECQDQRRKEVANSPEKQKKCLDNICVGNCSPFPEESSIMLEFPLNFKWEMVRSI